MKQTITSVLCGMAALVFTSGCATPTTQFLHMPDQSKTVEDPAKSRIYVISSRPSMSLLAIRVFDGKKGVGRLGDGFGYLCWEREPGETIVRIVGADAAEPASDTELAKGERGVHLYARKGECFYLWAGNGSSLRVYDKGLGRKWLENAKPAVFTSAP